MGQLKKKKDQNHTGWEINRKRLESLAALLPSDGMGRVPAGVEGGGWQALKSHSGVASYHAGVWLGSTGWLITSDGRGQHSIRLHESPPVDQAGRQWATEHSTTVGDNTFMAVGVDRGLTTPLAGPRPFDVFISCQVGGHEVSVEP